MYFPEHLSVADRPAKPAAGVPGWFTGGNKSINLMATPVYAWWLNVLLAELKAVIEAAGIALDRDDDTQLLQSIQALIAASHATAAVALVEASPVAVDLGLGSYYTLDLTTSRTLGNPTNITAGKPFLIRFTQPAGGACGLAFEGNWQFEGGEAQANSTTANAVDYLVGVGMPGGKVFAHMKLAIA